MRRRHLNRHRRLFKRRKRRLLKENQPPPRVFDERGLQLIMPAPPNTIDEFDFTRSTPQEDLLEIPTI